MGTAPIVEIDAEERRKGFIALDAAGKLGVFHSTAHRTLLVEPVVEGQGILGLSPRANRMIVEAGGKLQPLSSTTRTRKFPGARCGARSGTRTTTSLNTSGNRPPPTPTSNPS
jgi:hypothetical protein